MSVELGLIIPVSHRMDDLGAILDLVCKGLEATGRTYEILFVLDGERPDRLEVARKLAAGSKGVRVLSLARAFGEGAALRAGVRSTTAPILMTHPAYFQVDGEVIPKLVEALDDGAEVAFASRLPTKESLSNRIQRWAFNAAIRKALWVRYRDVACGVRAIRRDVLDELSVHGSFHRFLPVLATIKGFQVREVDARQHEQATHRRVYSPTTYLLRLLDLVNVFFLLRFTQKPLRFFGLVGGALFAVGFAICLYLSILKVFVGAQLGERPLLLLGVLLVVLGFQTLALGLLGELVTFVQSSPSKGPPIREVLRRGSTVDDSEEPELSATVDEKPL